MVSKGENHGKNRLALAIANQIRVTIDLSRKGIAVVTVFEWWDPKRKPLISFGPDDRYPKARQKRNGASHYSVIIAEARSLTSNAGVAPVATK